MKHKSIKITLIMLMSFALLFSVYYCINATLIQENFEICDNIDIKRTESIPDFWDLTEIQTVALNTTYINRTYVWNSTYQKNFTVQNLYYTSQYWNNSQLRIYGVLIYPDNSSKDLGRVPGILLMHGLGGRHEQLLNFGFFLANQNYCILLIDGPGHGLSDGPYPSQEWIVPQGFSNYEITPELLNSTHFYLYARAGLRAVDLLLNQSIIDQTKIAVSGRSYGGITSLFISNIYWMKIKTAIPFIAAGDLYTGFSTSYTFFNLIVDMNEYDINDPSFSYLFDYFDPINYVNTTNNPPTLFVCGTNDEFFPISTFNDTYLASENDKNSISMSPGGHHGFLMYPSEGTFLYWLNYTLFNGSAPPKIQVQSRVISTFFGSRLEVTTNIDCNASISSIKLANNREVMGFGWVEKEMININASQWQINLYNLPIEADVTYYVIVEMEENQYIMFSSIIYQDSLTTLFEIPFIILLSVILSIPIYLLIRRDINKKFQKVPESDQKKFIILYGSQVVGMGISEFFILFSFISPIVVLLPQSNAYGISLGDILNHFVDLVPISVVTSLIVILLMGLIFSISKPIIGGIINFIIPLFIFLGLFLVYSIFQGAAENVGINLHSINCGIGLILWTSMVIIQIIFGILKIICQKRIIKGPNLE
ncbi:MAG: prolyl oligopeptidase family serine peptidase [Candidatus Lokiarchaeota archaeon]|nr:prolyl oligopeptidase family serine peptidase [Candidatus Lokiarchaeota archaeon]